MPPLKSYSIATWGAVTGIDCEFKGNKTFRFLFFLNKVHIGCVDDISGRH